MHEVTFVSVFVHKGFSYNALVAICILISILASYQSQIRMLIGSIKLIENF